MAKLFSVIAVMAVVCLKPAAPATLQYPYKGCTISIEGLLHGRRFRLLYWHNGYAKILAIWLISLFGQRYSIPAQCTKGRSPDAKRRKLFIISSFAKNPLGCLSGATTAIWLIAGLDHMAGNRVHVRKIGGLGKILNPLAVK